MVNVKNQSISDNVLFECVCCLLSCIKYVTDPGFPRRGSNPSDLEIFAENCMKMKEIGARGGVSPMIPLGSAKLDSTSGSWRSGGGEGVLEGSWK